MPLKLHYIARERPQSGRAATLQIFHTLRGLAAVAPARGVEVLFVTPWPESLVRARCAELTGLDLPASVRVASLGHGPRLPWLHRAWPGPVWPAILARLSRYLADAAGSTSPSVVYTRNRLVAAQTAPERRPPLIFEEHSLRFREKAETRSLPEASPEIERLRSSEGEALRRSQGVVAITRALLDDIQQALPFDAPAWVIPDGAATELFSVPSEERKTEPWSFLYVGSLRPWKGLATTLDALSFAPRARLDIVGGDLDGTDARALRHLVRAHGLEARVRLHGSVPQPALRPFLARASAGILSLDGRFSIAARYTSPLKLFEYLAAGLPVLATRLPSLSEVIVDGENGLLFEPGDARALGLAMRRLGEDPTLRERLARGALEAAPRFTWERRAESILEACEAVLGTGAPSGSGGRPG